MWATGPCFYCGRATFRCAGESIQPYKYTRDHVVPRAHFDCNTHRLLTVACCNACNIRKGTLPARAFINRYIPKQRRHKIDWATIDRAYEIAAELINKKPQASVPVPQ